MEQFPTNTNEKINELEQGKQKIREKLKTSGEITAETTSEINEWFDNKRELAQTPEEEILLEADRADLYLSQGDLEGGLRCIVHMFGQVRSMANSDELEEKVFIELERRYDPVELEILLDKAREKSRKEGPDWTTRE